MVSANEPSPPPAQGPPFLARLGVSGKLLAAGALAGVIVTFLPLISVSVEAMGLSESDMVAEDWRGMLCLGGYVATLILVAIVYQPAGVRDKTQCWLILGVGLATAVLALWLLILAFDAGGNASEFFDSVGVDVSVGIGAYLNVLTGAAVAAGGFLKAREEKLV